MPIYNIRTQIFLFIFTAIVRLKTPSWICHSLRYDACQLHVSAANSRDFTHSRCFVVFLATVALTQGGDVISAK